jgi:hypothetical protein
MSVMAQHAASPPLAHSRAGAVYLVLDDVGGLDTRTGKPTRLKPTPRRSSPMCYPVNIGIPCAWWRSTSPRAGRAMSAQTSREKFALVRASWSKNCQPRYAISWSGRVHESSPEPTPVRCRTAASSAATQAARRVKDTARPHARRGDEPSLMRHGISVA